MPLYTYVATYKGESYVSQARRSNPKGFPDWIDALPSVLRGKVNPYDGAFEPMPNRQHVWCKTLIVGENELVVFAVQTDG